jgi:serine/threonine protein kinase
MSGKLTAGYILQERYVIVHQLGTGGMGTVYLTQDRRLSNRFCAVKEMIPDPTATPTERGQMEQQFQREAAILAELSHTHLPKVFDYFVEGGNYYLVMDYIEGETLETKLQRASDTLPEAQVLNWAMQLCDVLDYLHQQHPPVVFRDLKPSNIMIDSSGTIKLVDFGIARLFDPRKQTDTLKMGTLGYAPPEQYQGRGQTGPRSDLYALGATIHHLLTGRDPSQEAPFSFPAPRSLNPSITTKTETVVMKALAYDQVQRFDSAQAMKAALVASSEGEKTTARPWWPPVLIAFNVLLLVTVGFILWRFVIKPTPLVVIGSTPTAMTPNATATWTPAVTPVPPTLTPTEAPTQVPATLMPPTSTPVPSNTMLPTETPSPLPTATLAQISPTPTRPRPTATSTPRWFPPPVLVGPADGMHYSGRGSNIVLSWEGVGQLGANEYYVVNIPHQRGTEFGWTKQTYWEIPKYLYDLAPSSRELKWQVRVERFAGTGALASDKGGIALGEFSRTRSFWWDTTTFDSPILPP